MKGAAQETREGAAAPGRVHEPWFAGLRERVEDCYAAPMLSRDEALGLLRVTDAADELFEAASAFLIAADDKVIPSDVLPGEIFRLSAAASAYEDSRVTNSQPGSGA